MKLKAIHYWTQDGRVVVEVRDHDAKVAAPIQNKYTASYRHYPHRLPLIATLVHTMIFPRGTTKEAVKMAKKSAIMLYELKMNEVSRTPSAFAGTHSHRNGSKHETSTRA